MVDGGDLHIRLKKSLAVRLQRHRQKVEIGGVAQQVLVNAQIGRQPAVGADPDLTHRLVDAPFQRIVDLNRAYLQRPLGDKLLPHLFRQQMRHLLRQILL